MSLNKEVKQEIVNNYALKQGDTGSVEVQVALYTHRITELTEHLKINKKDFQSRRGLLVLVIRRKRLLAYLKRQNEQRYQKLISSLGLRK